MKKNKKSILGLVLIIGSIISCFYFLEIESYFAIIISLLIFISGLGLFLHPKNLFKIKNKEPKSK